MVVKCEFGDCDNEANLYAKMYLLTGNGAVFDPTPVCIDCYSEHGFEEC